jgi:hypothetical protein
MKPADNVVCIGSIDGRIWDPGPRAVEILQKLRQHETVVIDLMNEAPDLAHTELADILDHMAAAGVAKHRICIRTGNMIESFDRFTLDRTAAAMVELPDFQALAPTLTHNKNILQHFGCLVGRANMMRLILASHLWCNYRDKSLVTFHYRGCSDYHREHLGLEELLYHFGTGSTEYQEAREMLEHVPIAPRPIEDFPLLYPANTVEPLGWYDQFFVDIVCETFYTGQTFFLTEKFWRCVSAKTPFIIQGPQHMLRRLRNLGFRTFDSWWDEGYSEDPGLHTITEIKRVLAQLSVLTTLELQNMHDAMQPVLEHNFQRMLELKPEHFDSIQHAY